MFEGPLNGLLRAPKRVRRSGNNGTSLIISTNWLSVLAHVWEAKGHGREHGKLNPHARHVNRAATTAAKQE